MKEKCVNFLLFSLISTYIIQKISKIVQLLAAWNISAACVWQKETSVILLPLVLRFVRLLLWRICFEKLAVHNDFY